MSTVAPQAPESIDIADLLRPEIEAALDEADEQRDLPAHLHARLRAAGVFRLLTPREYGGSETPR